MYVYIYIYIYNRAQPLTTELSDRTIRCAYWSTGSSDHEAQVIAR